MKHASLALVWLASLLLPACGGGGGGGGGGGIAPVTANTRVLVGSTGDAGLFALHTEVEELRLVRDDGTRSANLVTPRELELVGLGEEYTWLAGAEVPPGTYTELEVVVDPDTAKAMDMTGRVLPLTVPQPTWRVALDTPATVSAGDVKDLWLEVDLDQSVQQIVAGTPTLGFDGVVYIDVPRPEPIDEFRGLVYEASLLDKSVTVDGFAGTAPLGLIEVLVVPSTVLVDDTGFPFASDEAFFASLRIGMTLLEVQGDLDSRGTVIANRIEILDQGGGIGMPPLVEIEGMVLYIDSRAEFFVLLIRDIEEGAEIAKPVLRRLGNPSSIDVYWDSDTRFQLRDGTRVRPDALEIGQIVDVEFGEFSRPPFVADEVEIEVADVCLRGEIEDASGLPREIVLEVDEDEYWCYFPGGSRGGEEEEEIRVQVGSATVELDLRGRPALRRDQLLEDLKVTVCGRIDRSGREPVLIARYVLVKPGHLIKGEVESTSPLRSYFIVDDAKVVQGFGEPVEDDPYGIVLSPEAYFLQDASSEREFFRLFDGLQAGETLEVKIKGVGTGRPDEIEAFEVKSKVRKDKGS